MYWAARGVVVVLILVVVVGVDGKRRDRTTTVEDVHMTKRTHTNTHHTAEETIRIRTKMRAMTETQTVELLALLWNNAPPSYRLSMIRLLFDGYPPPRLTSTEELMKLEYPMKTLSIPSASFLEELESSGMTEKEKLHQIEVNLWPKLSDKTHIMLIDFLQLTTTELHRIDQFRTKRPDGWIWDSGAILLNDDYWSTCDSGCSFETPTCSPFQGKTLCVKKCVGDPNCYAFIDPFNKRMYPGKCIVEEGVCHGFTYYDPRQEQDTVVPFHGKSSGNGWSIGSLPWESSGGVISATITVFSLALPIVFLFFSL